MQAVGDRRLLETVVLFREVPGIALQTLVGVGLVDLTVGDCLGLALVGHQVVAELAADTGPVVQVVLQAIGDRVTDRLAGRFVSIRDLPLGAGKASPGVGLVLDAVGDRRGQFAQTGRGVHLEATVAGHALSEIVRVDLHAAVDSRIRGAIVPARIQSEAWSALLALVLVGLVDEAVGDVVGDATSRAQVVAVVALGAVST